jgi:hypothetical protein
MTDFHENHRAYARLGKGAYGVRLGVRAEKECLGPGGGRHPGRPGSRQGVSIATGLSGPRSGQAVLDAGWNRAAPGRD